MNRSVFIQRLDGHNGFLRTVPDGIVGSIRVLANHFQRMDNRRFPAVIRTDQNSQSLGRFNDRADVGHVVFEHDSPNHLILNSALRATDADRREPFRPRDGATRFRSS